IRTHVPLSSVDRKLPSGARPRVPPPSAENDAPMRTRAFLALPVMLLAVAVTPLAAAAWDPGVAALQVGLHTRGLYAGPIDGIAGPATLTALGKPPAASPLPLAWPLTVHVIGDRFGPRGERWHAGIDLPAPLGTPVYAARAGEVVWAGWRGDYGFLVTVAH